MSRSLPNGSYSTDVRITLHIDSRRIRVAKIGPDRLYLDAPQTLFERSGEVVMHIDGHERRWRVNLQPNATPTRVIAVEYQTR